MPPRLTKNGSSLHPIMEGSVSPHLQHPIPAYSKLNRYTVYSTQYNLPDLLISPGCSLWANRSAPLWRWPGTASDWPHTMYIIKMRAQRRNHWTYITLFHLNTTSAQSRYQVHWLNFSKWNQKAALHPACRAVANAQAAVASDRNPAPGTPGTLQQVKHSSHLLFQWIPPNNPSKTSGISWLTSPGVIVEAVKKTHHCEENIFCVLTSYQVTRPATPWWNYECNYTKPFKLMH